MTPAGNCPGRDVTNLSSARSVRIGMKEKTRRGVSIRTAGLALCLAAILPAAVQAAPAGATAKAERPRDCTTEARLSGDAPTVVNYVVWCGVQPGPVTLRIRRPQSSPLRGFSPIAEASGPGACRAPALPPEVQGTGLLRRPQERAGDLPRQRHRRPRDALRGQAQIQRLALDGRLARLPTGCPRSYEQPVRRLRQIISSRAYYGLDRDLGDDHAAIRRRARGLLDAWRRGDPVARWTYEEEAFGMPLRAAEQTELKYRDTFREHFQDMVEEGDWVAKNAPNTYAGYELDEAAGGIIYVGFTVEPEATLERLKRHLIAPDRFKPFPITPTYTEDELEAISEEFILAKSPLLNLVNSVGIDYLANKVELGTQHVARVRRLIAARYGPDAPFEVVFEFPAVLL